MSHTQLDTMNGNGKQSGNLSDPEVVARAERRYFTAEYKRHILQEVEACTHTGDVGALLRREGLYSSHLTAWRRQRERGKL